MIRSGRVVSKVARLTTLVVTVAMAMSLFEGGASAQVEVRPVPARSGVVVDLAGVTPHLDHAGRSERRSLHPIRDSLDTIDFGAIAPQAAKETAAQTAPSGRRRSVTRKVIGAAIGATAGLFAGGYLGAVIEGDGCHCDDPGLMGALIGAPVGAVTGGILGAIFF